MKIGGFNLEIKDEILVIKPTNIQLSLQYVKEALGIDDSFIFKSMFFGIEGDILNKKETKDSVTYEYVISKKDMAKITFYMDMTCKAWVNGTVVFKDTFTSNDIVDLVQATIEEYEKTKKVVDPTFISYETFFDVPESKITFYKDDVEMSRLENSDKRYLVYKSLKNPKSDIKFIFTVNSFSESMEIDGIEIISKDFDSKELYFDSLDTIVENFVNRINAVLKVKKENKPKEELPKFIGYKNRKLFTLKDIKNAGFKTATEYISENSISIRTLESNGYIGVIEGFTKYSPALTITIFDSGDNVIGNTKFNIPPNSGSSTYGYDFDFLVKAYNKLLGGEGSYTIRELKTATKKEGDNVTLGFLCNLCDKYSDDIVHLMCRDKHIYSNLVWYIESNIINTPLIIKKSNVTGDIEVSCVVESVVKGTTREGIEESVKAYVEHCKDSLQYKPEHLDVDVKPGDIVKIDTDNMPSLSNKTGFVIAEDAGIVKLIPNKYSSDYNAVQDYGQNTSWISAYKSPNLFKETTNYVTKPKYKNGDLVQVDLDNISFPYQGHKYNITSALKTAKGICMVRRVLYAWKGIAYIVIFPNSYTKGKEWKTIYESSIIGKVVAGGTLSTENPNITDGMSVKDIEKELKNTFGDTLAKLTGAWGGQNKQRAVEVSKAVGDVQTLINSKYPELSKHLSKNDGVYKNIQILNTTTVPGKPDALACVGGTYYGTATGTSMCFPTKDLSTETPDDGVVTGEFIIKAKFKDGKNKKTVHDVYAHEFGHIIHAGINNAKIIKLIEEEYEDYKKKFNVSYIPQKLYKLKVSGDFISQYSFTNEKEMFAEAFTVYSLGTEEQKAVIPKGLFKIIDMVTKGKEI